MRLPALASTLLLTLLLAAAPADAAKRFGGGGNLGKQRAVPAKEAPASTPATPAPASPAAAPAPAGAGAAGAAAAAKPGFMSRWGGLLAGLGIGMLLSSLFGAQMGPIVGLILALLLGGVLLFFLFRLFANRGAAPAGGPRLDGGMAGPGSATGSAPGARPAFSGIGSALAGAAPAGDAPPAGAGTVAAGPAAAAIRPDFDVHNFLRGAKTSFIRLQAASDAKDLDDIRNFTTPELYAEIQMQLQDRGDVPTRTEVVSVDARLADLVVEDGYDVASVRFTGLIREDDAKNPEPFDELWHVRKKVGDRNPAWLIAGIQQVAE